MTCFISVSHIVSVFRVVDELADKRVTDFGGAEVGRDPVKSGHERPLRKFLEDSEPEWKLLFDVRGLFPHLKLFDLFGLFIQLKIVKDD